MALTLVVLAAGAGSRYGGSKQLAPIGPGGEALLEYSVYDALCAGFGRAVLVVRPEAERAFRDRFDRGMARRVPISYAHQRLDELPAGFARPAGRTKPWGTAHAVLAAESAVEGPFGVVNADDFYGSESFEELARLSSAERAGPVPTLVLVGFEVAETLSEAGPVSRALCRLDGDGRLREIVELEAVWRQNDRIVGRDRAGVERQLAGDELASMNLWGFTPHLFAELRRGFRDFLARTDAAPDAEFGLPDVIQSLVSAERARVEVLRGAGRWHGITFREDQRRVAKLLATLVAEGRYPKELWT